MQMTTSSLSGKAIGVEAALQTPQGKCSRDVSPQIRADRRRIHLDIVPSPTLFSREFSLKDRVAIVTGAYGGLGLETALAFIEAGARVVYCVGRSATAPERWVKLRDYVGRMAGKGGEGRLEYVSADVTDRVRCIILVAHDVLLTERRAQERMLKVVEEIGDKEGRLDVCVASHGVGPDTMGCLDCTPEILF